MKQILSFLFLFGLRIFFAQPDIKGGEYFFGAVDPGNGSGTAFTVVDGAWDEAVESIIASAQPIPNLNSPVLVNIRLKDNSNNWGPLFKKTIFINSGSLSTRSVDITYAEYFFGVFDPGQGQGTPIIAFDGALDDAVESVLRTNATWTVTTSPTLFNIRMRDANNNWGPLFKKTVFPYGANPNASLISQGDSLSVCPGSNATLSYSGPNGYTPTWFNGSTSTSITFPVTTAGYYVLSATLGNSTYLDSIYIDFLPIPTPTVSPSGSILVCASSAITLTTPVVANTSYQWYFNGVVISGATSSNYLPSQAGNYYVSATSSLNGCVANSNTTNLFTTAIISPNGSITSCSSPVILTSALGAGNTYQWKLNGVNIGGATSSSYNANVSGNYSVVITNGLCNSTSATTSVLINSVPPIPTINSLGQTTFCSGGSVVLTSSAPTGNVWSNGATTQSITVNQSGSFTVTVSNNGCSSTSSATIVTVNALPTVSAGNNQTVCAGTAVNLSGSGAASYTWNNGVNNGVAFTPASTQTYTVTGTAANGCTNTAQVTVTVNALPSVSAGNNQTICAGTPVTLSGSGAASYTWNNGVNNGVAFTPALTQTYIVTGTDANGCSNTAQVTVTVNTLPTANAGNNATIDCTNNPNGVIIGSLPQVGYQYTWSPASGLSAVNTANPTANPAVTTTYNLNVVETATGCSAAGQVVVTVNTVAPQANAGQSATITCVNNTGGVSLGNTQVAGLTYAWSPSTGLSANNIANPIALPASTTSYTLTVTNPSNGCSSNGTVTITMNNALPSVNAGPNQSICIGQSVTLTATGANTYTWNNGVIQGVAFSPAGTQTYTVQGTNTTNGCTNTAQVTVTVNSLPTVSAASNQTVCAGTAVTLSGSGAASYTWNNGVNNGVAFTPASTQTYTVTGTNANGCSNSAQVTVTVNPLPSVNAGPDQSVCSGTSVTLSGSGAASYTWNNGVNNGVAFTPASTQTYTVIGTNANGCQNTDQVVVTLNPLPSPTVQANGTAPFCPGTNVLLSTQAIAGYTYQWFNGANQINGAVSSTYTAIVSGTYSVKVTAPGGCFATSNSLAVSYYLTPIITANGPSIICQGGSVALQTVAGVGYQYSWMKNGMTMINPNMGNVYTATSAGSYKVKIVTPNGCVMYSNSITVTMLQNPSAAITAQGPVSFCNGSSVVLTANNNANAVVYQWRKNGVNVAAATSQSYTVTQSGTYTVEIANQACPNTSAVVSNGIYVNVFPTPNPSIGASTLVLTPGSTSTLSTITGVSLTYQWFKLWGANWLSITGATQSTYTTNSAGTYRVKVTNTYGCWKNSSTITLATSQMPQEGVSCTEKGIHVKLQEGIPAGGLWYEERDQERTRVTAEWNEGMKEWCLLGKADGQFVYTTLAEEGEEADQWIRISEVCNATSLIAYPNPTWNVVYLKGLDATEKHYELHDVMGRVVAVGHLSAAQNTIDMSNLAPGAYRLVMQGYGVIAIVKE
jgi:hypothetical protein